MSSSCIKNVCRICLDQNIALDWNNEISEYCGMTYKDCYYQCTQLELVDGDAFSSMLCRHCCKELENVHTLILKAVESHKFFLDKYNKSSSSTADDISNDIRTEFETILVKEIEEEDLMVQNYLETSSCVKEFNITKNDERSKGFNISINSEDEDEEEDKFSNQTLKSENSEDDVSLSSKKPFPNKIEHENKSTKSVTSKDDRNESKKFKLNDSNKVKQKRKVKNDTAVEDKLLGNETKDDSGTEVTVGVKKKQKIGMCSICAKILKNKSVLRAHEKTHTENRERKATCPICDLKFYNKSNLTSHMEVHKKNREKKHICEFCDKAFYKRAGLNDHRRIHLGQMIPCNLCSKEFYRQIDLDIHMISHSATTINADEKKRSKYSVRCDYCEKLIRSTSFKSHRAAHLKEPLMKCSICNKEYFLKSSCIQHIKTVHQKTREESYNLVTMYETHRMSHLFLKQKANIQPCDEM